MYTSCIWSLPEPTNWESRVLEANGDEVGWSSKSKNREPYGVNDKV